MSTCPLSLHCTYCNTFNQLVKRYLCTQTDLHQQMRYYTNIKLGNIHYQM